jgi:hypothetical protein
MTKSSPQFSSPPYPRRGGVTNGKGKRTILQRSQETDAKAGEDRGSAGFDGQEQE